MSRRKGDEIWEGKITKKLMMVDETNRINKFLSNKVICIWLIKYLWMTVYSNESRVWF